MRKALATELKKNGILHLRRSGTIGINNTYLSTVQDPNIHGMRRTQREVEVKFCEWRWHGARGAWLINSVAMMRRAAARHLIEDGRNNHDVDRRAERTSLWL